MTHRLRSAAAAAGVLWLVACGGGGGGAIVPPSGAVDDAAATLVGAAVFVNVLANDSGVAASPVVTIIAPPGHGTASVEPDQRLRYDPDPGFNGSDTITYSVPAASGPPFTATVAVATYLSMAAGAPGVLLPRTSITPREVAVLVNDSDTQSVAVAAYYAPRRHIPPANVIHLNFPAGGTDMTAANFAPLKAAVDAAVGADIEALVLTWTNPWRVEGMAITSAFALGYDVAYTVSAPCDTTKAVAYFGTESVHPFTDYGVRPTMMLAGESTANVLTLIDRGIASDDTFPTGTAWMVRTTDPARSVRYPSMEQAVTDWNHAPDGLTLAYIDNSMGGGSDVVTSTNGILFYLTGLVSVAGIDTNTYLPGAVADHLTSYGGILTGGSGQMSILRWLEAGATASFGTVVEPCNYTEKFPDPGILLDAYYRGATVIEAYWKSVAWPGEGIFVGEPLARPWGDTVLTYDAAHTLTLETTRLVPNRLYDLLEANAAGGAFHVVIAGISIPHHQRATVTLANAVGAVYKLQAQ